MCLGGYGAIVKVQEGLARLQTTVMQDHRNSFTELSKSFLVLQDQSVFCQQTMKDVFFCQSLNYHSDLMYGGIQCQRTTNMESLHDVPDDKVCGQKGS